MSYQGVDKSRQVGWRGMPWSVKRILVSTCLSGSTMYHLDYKYPANQGSPGGISDQGWHRIGIEVIQLSLYDSYSSNLEDLKVKVQNCNSGIPEDRWCPYYRLERRRVNGAGLAGTPLMVVGQGPGPREQESGRPFSGGSGRLLREILKKVGLDPKEVFLTNLVRCMPPRNKRIISGAIKMCSQWLDDEVGIVKPRLIVCLGNEAAEALTSEVTRGELTTTKYGIQAVCVYHTAYLLRVKGKDPQKYKEIAEEEYEAWKLVAETLN